MYVSAMNTGICVCVLLAALSTSSCISLHTQSEDGVQSDLGTVVEHTRHTRAAPSSGQLSLLSKQEDDEEPRSSLTELLARIISTKGGILLSDHLFYNYRTSYQSFFQDV